MSTKIDITHSRFSDAPWYTQSDNVVLVGGAGGIGSWVSLLLARAGFVPFIYDFDLLEEVNLAGQILPKKSIGLPKVTALHEVITQFTNVVPYTSNSKITKESYTHNYVICGFDNMQARLDAFNSWLAKYGEKKDAIFIDGRLQAEHMQILCIRGGDAASIKRYQDEYIFPDHMVEDAPCSFKQTSHAAAMIASHMVGFFTNHLTLVKDPEIGRSVPFFWEYFIPIDYLVTA